MYKLSYKLKQHTPIIHFQHDQVGATLRATELKPKLDKFLIKEMGGEDKLKKEKASWFISKDHNALNYKIKIINNDRNPKIGRVVIIPPDSETWLLSNSTHLSLTVFDQRLFQNLKQILPAFFCLNNFGKRQTKGFGCFYPAELKEDDFKRLIKEKDVNLYRKTSQLRDSTQTDAFFYSKVIMPAWGQLKSGKNFKGYEKSEVFKFLASRNISWSKRWIKLKLKELIDNGDLPEDLLYTRAPNDITNNNTWEENPEVEYRFARSMLGLPEHYEFATTNMNIYHVKVSNNDIDRFSSPVTFKVFKKNIYAISGSIPIEMYNKAFSIEIQHKVHKRNRGNPISIATTIFTPKNRTEFDISFLDDHFSNLGFEKI